MSNADHNLIALGQLAIEYYLSTQTTKKAETRLERVEDALRRNPELSPSNFNVRNLYNHREQFAALKQRLEEVKAAQLNERRSKATLLKAAKEAA